MSGEVLPVVGTDHANGVIVLGNSGVELVEPALYFLNTAILYTKRFVTALSEETLLETVNVLPSSLLARRRWERVVR